MVGYTDMCMGTQMHMGKASDSSKIPVWDHPYMYGPANNMPKGYLYVWADHTCMKQPIRMWTEYLYGTEHTNPVFHLLPVSCIQPIFSFIFGTKP